MGISYHKNAKTTVLMRRQIKESSRLLRRLRIGTKKTGNFSRIISILILIIYRNMKTNVLRFLISLGMTEIFVFIRNS